MCFRAIYESPQSLRAQFGLSDTRNAIHASGWPCPLKLWREIHLIHVSFFDFCLLSLVVLMFEFVCLFADSEKSVQKEIAFHCPEFNTTEWYEKYEPYFSKNAVTLDSKTWEHSPIYYTASEGTSSTTVVDK
jgi:hypothetical protein